GLGQHRRAYRAFGILELPNPLDRRALWHVAPGSNRCRRSNKGCALLALERIQRSSQRYHYTRDQWRALRPSSLTGWGAAGAIALCALPVLLGFLLPLLILISLTLEEGHVMFGPRYIGFALNSLILAATAAGATVALALLVAYAKRLAEGPATRVAALVASMGYAVPGGVIAVGLLIPLAAFDNGLDAWMRASFGVSTGLLLTGSIAALVFAYVVRFMAIALQTVEAALGKVTPSMDHAARALGRSETGALRDVHAPMIRGGLLTAALIVFVDVMKELPATLIMRPFNFDTLAVQAYRLASDERLSQASTPSLAIVAVGLIPVVILAGQIRRSRPGHGG
ncbi:MAG: hypothetical protein KTR21_08570, partial [Rhodobacteraceae bacterium]|nr:hypothetical protein [Paracoccaceae bacterium]